MYYLCSDSDVQQLRLARAVAIHHVKMIAKIKIRKNHAPIICPLLQKNQRMMSQIMKNSIAPPTNPPVPQPPQFDPPFQPPAQKHTMMIMMKRMMKMKRGHQQALLVSQHSSSV
jgi:hypothetical protein